MSTATTSPLDQQIKRVRRRLFLQTLLDTLAWSWAIALLLSAVWYLVEPRVIAHAATWLTWTVTAGALGLGALVSLMIAWLVAPTPLMAALALDQRFNLKERVTTSIGMSEPQAETSAGRALVADVNNRVAPLRLAERFPIHLSWSALAVPITALLLVLLSVFYRPHRGGVQASDGNQPLTEDPALKQAIEQKKKDLLPPPDDKKADKRPRDPDLKKIEGDVAELAQQPTDTKEQANKFIKDAAKAEEALRDAERQMAARNDAVKERLNQEDRLNPDKLSKKKNGPAKNLQEAMKDGDFQRAGDALQQLSKMLDPEQQKRIADKLDKLKDKLGDNGLTPEERDRIKKELEKLNDELLTEEKKKDVEAALNELEQALDKLAEPEKQEKKLEEQLRELRKQAEQNAKEREEERKQAEQKVRDAEKKANDLSKIPDEQKKAEAERKKAEQEAEEQRKKEKVESQKEARQQEQTRRELEEMKKNNERLNQQSKDEMKDLAKQLGECDKALKDGKDGDAAKKLQEAREKLRQMTGDADRQQLLQQIQRLQQARQAVCQAMNEKGGEGNGNGKGDDAEGGGVASGRRPLGIDEETKHFETTAPAETGKGPLRITDFLNGPGGERGGPRPVQITDEMRIRAAQEGASALTRQRVERPSDTERVRGYFDNMRGPETPAPKK